jgi:hypothetical protein
MIRFFYGAGTSERALVSSGPLTMCGWMGHGTHVGIGGEGRAPGSFGSAKDEGP